MYDCTYFLYKALLKQFPYVPGRDVMQDAEKLKQVKAHPNHILEPYQRNKNPYFKLPKNLSSRSSASARSCMDAA